jgi:hypothetical protein
LTRDVRSFLGYQGPNGLLRQTGGGAFPMAMSPSVYWQCTVYGGDTLALISGGDDAAADMQAILEAQEDIFMFMGLLTEPDNWDRLLREVVGEPRFVQETEVVKETEIAKEADVAKKLEVVKEAEVAKMRKQYQR